MADQSGEHIELDWFTQDFDFPHHTSRPDLRIIVASTPRSGSTLLCDKMWATGHLGAPAEYFNVLFNITESMARRLKAASLDDYIAKLFARRTSPNGVFSVKLHFSQSRPDLIERLQPTHYVFTYRGDLIAQAVSYAKALQTNSWNSQMPETNEPVYSFDQILDCLFKVQREFLGWRKWFEQNGIKPLAVVFEDLVADPDKVVRHCAEWLGVELTGERSVPLPKVVRQGDKTNEQWKERFLQNLQSGSRLESSPLDAVEIE